MVKLLLNDNIKPYYKIDDWNYYLPLILFVNNNY